jgi:hypothetical protein
MDQDLLDALGATPTAMEKLYAEVIEDTRANTAKWNEDRAKWDEERQRLADFRAALTQHVAWLETEYGKLPPELFDDNDRLYSSCVMQGLEIRKQSMTTATTQSTMDDVINDGFRIGGEIFRRIQARRAMVTAGTLEPTAVPPAVV